MIVAVECFAVAFVCVMTCVCSVGFLRESGLMKPIRCIFGFHKPAIRASSMECQLGIRRCDRCFRSFFI